jgi:hypothetical protein
MPETSDRKMEETVLILVTRTGQEPLIREVHDSDDSISDNSHVRTQPLLNISLVC